MAISIFKNHQKKVLALICLAAILAVTLSSCVSKKITAVLPEVIDSGKSDSYAVIDGALYYTDERFYDRCLCRLDENGSKTICEKSDVGCGVEDQIQASDGFLYFSGRNEGNTFYFSYDPKTEKTEKLGSVDGITKYWSKQGNKIYYLTYGEDYFVFALNCYDTQTKLCTQVCESVIDFMIDRDALVYVAKNASEYSIVKVTPDEKSVLYSFTYDGDHTPEFALGSEACFANYFGEFSKLITFENGEEYDFGDNIGDAVLCGDTVYYVCYVRKNEYTNPDPTGLYVRKAGDREAVLLTDRLDTPQLICAYPDDSVLLVHSKGAVRVHFELSVIKRDKAALAAQF